MKGKEARMRDGTYMLDHRLRHINNSGVKSSPYETMNDKPDSRQETESILSSKMKRFTKNAQVPMADDS